MVNLLAGCFHQGVMYGPFIRLSMENKMTHKIFRMTTSLFLALALTILASGTQPVRAAGPWYITPTGDDNNDCLSPGTACGTINGAINKSSSGDTIYVAVGTFTGTGTEVVFMDKDITLSG